MGRLNHFERVRALAAGHSGVPVAEITPETRLVEDLGMDGDDGHEFLQAFADEFGVDMSGMDPFNYFDDEPPLGMASSLVGLIALFSTRFRAYARYAARGRRAVSVRNLIASARAGRWLSPSVPRFDADPVHPGLIGPVALFIIAGLSAMAAYEGIASGEIVPALLALMGAAFIGFRLIMSLNWLRRLDAAAEFEERATDTES